MTSKALTTPSLLIIMGRNPIKGGPSLTLERSLSGGMQQLHMGLACYCAKLKLSEADF